MADFSITPLDPVGAAEGFRQDQLRTMAMEQAVQAAPVARAIQQTQLERNRFDLGQLREEAARTDQFRNALPGATKGLEGIQKAIAVADSALNAGLWEPAQKALSLATLIDAREAQADARRQRAEMQAQTMATQRLDRIGKLYQGADTPLKYETAHQVYRQMFGEESPFASMPFTPETPQMVSAWSQKQMNDMEKALAEARIATANTRASAAEALASYRDRVLELRQQGLDIRRDSAAKRDGKIAQPSDREASYTARTLKQAYPKVDWDSDEAKLVSQEVLFDAKTRAARENIPITKALERELATRGPLFEQGSAGVAGFGQNWKPTPKGGSAVPAAVTSEAEYNKLPNGAKYTWNGKTYVKGAQ